MREKTWTTSFLLFPKSHSFLLCRPHEDKTAFNLSTSMAICYSVMFYHTSNMYTTDKKFLINKVLESNENYLSGC